MSTASSFSTGRPGPRGGITIGDPAIVGASHDLQAGGIDPTPRREAQDERIKRLRDHLEQAPSSALIDIEVNKDEEIRDLYSLARILVDRRVLYEHPKTRALSFKDKWMNADESGKLDRRCTVHILEDIPPIASPGGTYRLAKGDVVTLPYAISSAIINRGKAEEVHGIDQDAADTTTTLPPIERSAQGTETHTSSTDRPHPDSVEGAQERLKFTRLCREEDRTAILPSPRRFKIIDARKDDTGEICITAEIDGERKDWRYDTLEAEVGDHQDQYPHMALDLLQDAKARILALAGERPKEQGKGKVKRRPKMPEGEIWVEGRTEKPIVGFSTVRDGSIITHTLDDWRNLDRELADLIEEEYENARGVYHMPGRPDTDCEDPKLFQDLTSIVDRFVDLPPRVGKTDSEDSPYRTSMVAHIVCTAFYDLVAVRPGLIPVAETKTGKTRLITICALSSYRGLSIGAPTEAVILRAIGSYHVTLCVDECSDAAEVLPLLLNIYKLSFDGQNVARCDLNNQRGIITYPCKGFVTLSLKNLDMVPDDSINRGIIIHLGYKARELEYQEPSYPKFAPLFKDIRTRIAALRLRALAGKIDVPAALDRAGELARKKYAFGAKEYELDSRDFTKAQTLLLPIVLMGEDERLINDIMEVTLRSKLEGEEAQGQSLAASCWFALHDEVMNLWGGPGGLKRDKQGVPEPFKGRDITTKMIADTVRANLKNEGELMRDEDIKTRTVTESLKSLLFEFRPGPHRASYLVTDSPSFSMGWRNCVRKYGLPPEGEMPTITPRVYVRGG